MFIVLIERALILFLATQPRAPVLCHALDEAGTSPLPVHVIGATTQEARNEERLTGMHDHRELGRMLLVGPAPRL
jgi:hypothetical protein